MFPQWVVANVRTSQIQAEIGKWSKDIMLLPYPEPGIGGNFAKDGERKKIETLEQRKAIKGTDRGSLCSPPEGDTQRRLWINRSLVHVAEEIVTKTQMRWFSESKLMFLSIAMPR